MSPWFEVNSFHQTGDDIACKFVRALEGKRSFVGAANRGTNGVDNYNFVTHLHDSLCSLF